ncbi:hypothetical protein B0H15DRAFT_802051 [Mycena belliarum]|uniref:Uncharacterized protein n=1 Tax=Mycena belliarum TaxID=1033014 RepID=A0AAD6U5H8_9AGAR|nr:hypothetical protein B0H15DRAFT_802051 [Mycena belliae]
MKVDVLGSALLPKKSYVLYARLSAAQHTAYEAILSGGARGWLAGGVGTVVSKSVLASTPSSSPTKDPTTEEGRTHRHAKGKGKSRVRNTAEEEAERLRVAEAFRVKGAECQVPPEQFKNQQCSLLDPDGLDTPWFDFKVRTALICTCVELGLTSAWIGFKVMLQISGPRVQLSLTPRPSWVKAFGDIIYELRSSEKFLQLVSSERPSNCPASASPDPAYVQICGKPSNLRIFKTSTGSLVI